MNSHSLLCRYTYDPLDRLAASAQTGQPISQCFYQAGRLQSEVQGSARRMLMRHGDQVLAQRDEPVGLIEQRLLVSDRQHSIVHVSDTQGQRAMAYTPYGHRPADNRLSLLPGFGGEREDPLTGHYVLGNGYRSFNPILMRFNSPDSFSPFGQGGLNAYAYCLGDPVNYRDPEGHIPWWVGLVAGVAATVLTAGITAPVTATLGITAATVATFSSILGKAAIVLGVLSTGSAVGSAVTSGEVSEGLGWLSLGTGVAAGVTGGLVAGAKLGVAAGAKWGAARAAQTVSRPPPLTLTTAVNDAVQSFQTIQDEFMKLNSVIGQRLSRLNYALSNKGGKELPNNVRFVLMKEQELLSGFNGTEFDTAFHRISDIVDELGPKIAIIRGVAETSL